MTTTTPECGAGLHDGIRLVAHCNLEPGHTGWHTDNRPPAVAWRPTVPVELPHLPGCTATHRPLTSPCTTEPALGVIPWTSA